MQVLKDNRVVEVEVVGHYGWEENPVVLYEGEEYVAEEYYVSETNEKICSVCQSSGCDYCEGGCIGCRHGIYNYDEDRTEYCI